ncbi:hypothetical protein BKA70DRAFT_1234298 [Coprinopsis sp. MPI-PUGE-AT-0042]|nr:hypothetical protein BKA70DRAFT_1234298 [Coprinopsis sp. MPI-PUGE-AT-0042]
MRWRNVLLSLSRLSCVCLPLRLPPPRWNEAIAQRGGVERERYEQNFCPQFAKYFRGGGFLGWGFCTKTAVGIVAEQTYSLWCNRNTDTVPSCDSNEDPICNGLQECEMGSSLISRQYGNAPAARTHQGLRRRLTEVAVARRGGNSFRWLRSTPKLNGQLCKPFPWEGLATIVDLVRVESAPDGSATGGTMCPLFHIHAKALMSARARIRHDRSFGHA